MKKIKYFFLSLFLSANVSAVSISSKDKEIIHDPSIATKVLVGKAYEDQFGKQFIIPSLSWTSFKTTIEVHKLSVYGGRVYRLKTGEWYLIYSKSKYYDSTKIIDEDPISFELLKDSKEIIKVFSNKFHEKGRVNPSWKYCHENKECTLEVDSCKNKHSISKEYKEIFAKHMKEKTNSCPQKQEVNMISLKCVNYFCE